MHPHEALRDHDLPAGRAGRRFHRELDSESGWRVEAGKVETIAQATYRRWFGTLIAPGATVAVNGQKWAKINGRPRLTLNDSNVQEVTP
jgi:hypothetical protein